MGKDRNVTLNATSRRGFFEAALTGGAAIAAMGASTQAEPRERESQDPLEELVARYGSEFGDIRQVR